MVRVDLGIMVIKHVLLFPQSSRIGTSSPDAVWFHTQDNHFCREESSIIQEIQSVSSNRCTDGGSHLWVKYISYFCQLVQKIIEIKISIILKSYPIDGTLVGTTSPNHWAVGRGLRKHRLLLCRGVRSPNECPSMTLNYLMVRFQ